jgi:hypothetical protein
VAFADGKRVAAKVSSVRLVRGPSSDRAAAQRLGCFG